MAVAVHPLRLPALGNAMFTGEMPPWLQSLLATLLGGGGLYTIHKVLFERRGQKHSQDLEKQGKQYEERQRETAAQVVVLNGVIDQLRADHASYKKSTEEQMLGFAHAREAQSKIVNELKSEHTACKVRTAQLEEQLKFAEEKIGEIAEQNNKLRREFRQYKRERGGHRGDHPAG